jgi:tetratricopeptide (TPR) repeat protein
VLALTPAAGASPWPQWRPWQGPPVRARSWCKGLHLGSILSVDSSDCFADLPCAPPPPHRHSSQGARQHRQRGLHPPAPAPLVQAGRVEEAIRELSAAYHKQPSRCPLELYLQLGRCYLLQGQQQYAKNVLLQATAVSPCASTWAGLATALYRAGDLDGADLALTEANVLDPGNPVVWGQLALVALVADRVGDAEKVRARACGGSPWGSCWCSSWCCACASVHVRCLLCAVRVGRGMLTLVHMCALFRRVALFSNKP